MSRAFVKEHDGDAPEDFPERPVSTHPNFVTTRGLQQIENQIRELESARERARVGEDKATLSHIERELRYWQQRKASARLVEPDPSPEVVRFGVQVTLRYEDGEERAFTIVGEDEAAPAQGRISWMSPIAQTLIGARVGDEPVLQGRAAEITALASPH